MTHKTQAQVLRIRSAWMCQTGKGPDMLKLYQSINQSINQYSFLQCIYAVAVFLILSLASANNAVAAACRTTLSDELPAYPIDQGQGLGSGAEYSMGSENKYYTGSNATLYFIFRNVTCLSGNKYSVQFKLTNVSSCTVNSYVCCGTASVTGSWSKTNSYGIQSVTVKTFTGTAVQSVNVDQSGYNDQDV
jgi:hypothetical protein